MAGRSLKTLLCFFFLVAVTPFPAAFSAEAPSGKDPEQVHVLSLVDCLNIALDNSFEVKMARLDLLIAETDLMYSNAVFDTVLFGNIGYTEDKRQELSVFSADDDQVNVYSAGISKKLPSGTEVSAVLTDTRYWDNSGFISKNPSHNAELQFEARQPIGKNFFGYADRAGVTMTALAVKNSDLASRDRIEQLLADTALSYTDLLFAKRSLDIYSDIYDRAEKLYGSIKKNYQIGISEKVDLLAAEANLANRKADLIIARNSYRDAMESLKLIMNLGEDVRILPEEGLSFEPLKAELSDCLEKAFRYRRDYRINKRDLEIRGIDLKVKKNALWPEIDLVGTFSMNGLEKDFSKAISKTTVADNTYYFGGVEFSWPLENRAARALSRKASREKEKAVLAIKRTERRIITQVGIAYEDTVAYGAGREFTRRAMGLQSEKLEEEEKNFLHGRSGTKRLIDYQQDLLFSELEDARALLNHRKAKVELFRKMNIILENFEEVL
ncbi:MAG: hypothetical protein GF408_00545 [Candidatus Omnitrophica bacterium]|nr:hypothetical protein [Candidatus Omnitrophota bacterium]